MAHLPTEHVWFDEGFAGEGGGAACFAIVLTEYASGNLDLLFKSARGQWETADDVPRGTGGRTWHT